MCPARALALHQLVDEKKTLIGPTLALFVAIVDASASYENVVNDREGTFATYPLSVNITDACIVQSRSFVHENAASVDIAGKRHLLGVEIVEA